MSIIKNTFYIYSFHKDSSLNKQAEIEELDESYSIKMNLLPQQISHMDTYLSDLFNLMMKFEKENPYGSDVKIQTKRYEYSNGEFVQATIFYRVLMRKGSYFYVIQKSDRGFRFLLFAIDRVHHSSNSLGFRMRTPDVIEQRNEMQNILKKLDLGVSLSLIENSSLYFL